MTIVLREIFKTLAEDLNGQGNIAVVWLLICSMERRNVIIDAFINVIQI